MQNKFKFLIITIIVILVISGGYIYYTYTQYKLDKTAGWKTYTNNQYGFEIKYPPKIGVLDNESLGGEEIYSVSFINLLFKEPLAGQQSAGRKIAFNISIFNNNNQLQNAFGVNSDPYRIRIVQGETIVGGYNAQKILFKPKNVDDVEGSVYLINEKNMAIMVYDTKYNQVSESDINQILSTFKFTK